MLSWISRMKQRRDEDARRRKLDEALEAAESWSNPGSSQPFLRAADLSAELGEYEKARRLYGRAVDRYIEAGMHRAALAATRKILELAPHSARARCTQSWLLLGQGDRDAFSREVLIYAGSAAEHREHRLARWHVRQMASVTSDREMRAALGRAYAELEERQVAPLLPAPKDKAVGERLFDERMREAVLTSPASLRDQLPIYEEPELDTPLPALGDETTAAPQSEDERPRDVLPADVEEDLDVEDSGSWLRKFGS